MRIPGVAPNLSSCHQTPGSEFRLVLAPPRSLRSIRAIRPSDCRFLAGGACRAATSPSAWSGRKGPSWAAVAPLYAAQLVAARRVPPPTSWARWGLSRCEKPVRVERTEWAALDGPLRRSTRRNSSQRDEFHLQQAGLGGGCRAATSPSAWSGRKGPSWAAVAPLYAAQLVAARRVPPPTSWARWGLSRCDKPVRVERTEGGRPGRPLRRSRWRCFSQREEFHRKERPQPSINGGTRPQV